MAVTAYVSFCGVDCSVPIDREDSASSHIDMTDYVVINTSDADPTALASPTETDQISHDDDAGSILPVLDYESEGSTDLVSDGSATPGFIGVVGEAANAAANATVASAAAAESEAQKQARERQQQAQREQMQREQEARDKQSAKDSVNTLRSKRVGISSAWYPGNAYQCAYSGYAPRADAPRHGPSAREDSPEGVGGGRPGHFTVCSDPATQESPSATQPGHHSRGANLCV